MQYAPAHPQEAARLALLDELALLDTAPEPEFDAVTRLLQQALGLPITLMSMVDSDRQWFKSRQGLDAAATPRSISFCGHAVAAGRPLLVPDARLDPRFEDSPLVTGAPHIVFYAGAPLLVEGLPLGSICAVDTRVRDDGDAVAALLQTASELLSRLLGARLQAERARRGEALALATAQLNSDWAWQTDASGQLCWLDERYAAATGIDPRQQLGQPLLAAGCGAPSGDDAALALRNALRGGTAFRQLPVQWPTAGGMATLLFSGVPLLDATGQPMGHRGTAHDPRRGLRAVARAERAEKLLLTAAEQFGGAVMLADTDGRILMANSCWRTLYAEHLGPGRDWPELLRRAVLAGEFPQAVGREAEFVAARLDPAADVRAPLELLRGGRWWLTQEHRLADGALLQVALDVTANKAAEARWRYHAELHQAVAEVASDGIAVVNQYGDVIAFNPAAAHLWRRSAADMATLNIFAANISRVDDCGRPMQAHEHPVRRALREQRAIHGVRYGLERARSPIQWFDLDVIPLGNACEVVMVFRDVSEHRAASAASSADAALPDSLVPLLLRKTSEGAWQWDDRRGRLFLSPRCKQMLGYDAAALRSDRDVLQVLTHPDDLAGVQESLRRQLGGSGALLDLECRLQHADGGHRWVAVRGRINRDAAGKAIEASGLMIDITSQRAALAALAEKQSAQSASAAKSAFLSRVSHEIRTPLNAIVGFSRLLQRGRLSPSLQEPVACIHEAGQHLLGLVNDLLDVQRIETDSLPMSMEPVELRALMVALREMLGVEADSRQVRLRIDEASLAGLWVQADLQRLRQALMNGVSNAIKYGGDGQQVLLRASAAAGRVLLEVIDRGPGLSAEQQTRLFQPFERLGLERTGVPGTGLGLVISRRLVQAMGGQMGLRSVPGVGTTYWIELAAAQAPAAPVPPESDAGDSSLMPLAGTGREPLELLYVEDNPVNVILLETLIASLPDWRMRVATSGAEACQLLAHWTPDLLVLDAHLPDAHGLTLLPRLRALRPALARVPAVMFTADAMPQDHLDSRAAGFLRHWTKPIDVDAVLRELRSLARQLSGEPA